MFGVTTWSLASSPFIGTLIISVFHLNRGLILPPVDSFTVPYNHQNPIGFASISRQPSVFDTVVVPFQNKNDKRKSFSETNTLFLGSDDEKTFESVNDNGPSSSSVLSLSESDEVILGSIGIGTSLIMLYSEFVLKNTGCGLPAGPFGLIGAAEGLSYLFVTGLVGFSLYSKVKTGNGLPAGPGGVLGAGEGLSFLAVTAGLVVLVFQFADYGYLPNAVPMDGGMCQ